MKVSGIQNGYLSFDIQQDGHHIIVDAVEEFGGEGKGPTPKGLLISGLVGCTGMDVASILRKMKIEYEWQPTKIVDLTDEEVGEIIQGDMINISNALIIMKQKGIALYTG